VDWRAGRSRPRRLRQCLCAACTGRWTGCDRVFYYSGHGASDGSTNYIIPVDVKTTETGELWDQSLQLTEITRKLKRVPLQVLAEEIVKPDIEAVVMFRAVQRRVRAAIRQEPYLGFSALGDVYLAGKGEQTAGPAAPQPSRTQDKLGESFDGTWQFTRYDASGCADPHATFFLTISNDAISSGGERPATGRVDKAGNITFSRPAGIVKGATQAYWTT
jgi:hypothetical protein